MLLEVSHAQLRLRCLGRKRGALGPCPIASQKTGQPPGPAGDGQCGCEARGTIRKVGHAVPTQSWERASKVRTCPSDMAMPRVWTTQQSRSGGVQVGHHLLRLHMLPCVSQRCITKPCRYLLLSKCSFLLPLVRFLPLLQKTTKFTEKQQHPPKNKEINGLTESSWLKHMWCARKVNKQKIQNC